MEQLAIMQEVRKIELLDGKKGFSRTELKELNSIYTQYQNRKPLPNNLKEHNDSLKYLLSLINYVNDILNSNNKTHTSNGAATQNDLDFFNKQYLWGNQKNNTDTIYMDSNRQTRTNVGKKESAPAVAPTPAKDNPTPDDNSYYITI